MEIVENYEDRSGIRTGGESDRIQACKIDGGFDAFGLLGDFGGAIDDLARSFERRGIRQLYDHGHIAFVLRGNEAGGHELEAEPGQGEQAEIDPQGDGAEPN